MPLRIRPATALNVMLIGLALLALALIAFRAESAPGIEVERREPNGYVDTIVVDVRGAVAEPGVYAMSPGDRIEHAIDRAGGATGDADIQALNLALRVRDEDLIYVPSTAEAVPPSIDLNVATTEQLQELPGIGPARAAAIIAARPLAGVEDLVERRLIPASVYEQIRMLVTVAERQ